MVGLHVRPLTVQVSAQEEPSAPRKYSGAFVGDTDGVGEVVAVTDAVGVTVAVRDGVPVSVGVALLVGVGDGEGEQAEAVTTI